VKAVKNIRVLYDARISELAELLNKESAPCTVLVGILFPSWLVGCLGGRLVGLSVSQSISESFSLSLCLLVSWLVCFFVGR